MKKLLVVSLVFVLILPMFASADINLFWYYEREITHIVVCTDWRNGCCYRGTRDSHWISSTCFVDLAINWLVEYPLCDPMADNFHDLNDDGIVNFVDFAIWAEKYALAH